MARVYPLFSSSNGNSTFIGTEKCGILVDCGVSFKKIFKALEINNIPLKAIHGIFITHEHSDHIAGLKMLTKNTGIPVYGQKCTLQSLYDKNKIAFNSPVIDMNGKTIACGGNEVTCFNTPHDTIQSCGYRIRTADDKLCAVCTDLGCITETVNNALMGCRFVLLEANYDEQMLRYGSYPLYLKERILSDTGHLSNDSCGVQVERLLHNGTTHILLGHLSPENNRTDIAYSTVQSYLSEFTRGRDYLMGVAPAETTGGAVVF